MVLALVQNVNETLEMCGYQSPLGFSKLEEVNNTQEGAVSVNLKLI